MLFGFFLRYFFTCICLFDASINLVQETYFFHSIFNRSVRWKFLNTLDYCIFCIHKFPVMMYRQLNQMFLFVYFTLPGFALLLYRTYLMTTYFLPFSSKICRKVLKPVLRHQGFPWKRPYHPAHNL